MNPLAEKYYDTSPYAHCGNNPINIIDLDGREWAEKKDTEYANSLSNTIEDKIKADFSKMNKLNHKIAQRQAEGKDTSKQQAEVNNMKESMNMMGDALEELREMGGTKDQKFSFNKIDGQIGGAGINENGIINMDISGNGSFANGIHEASHGYDLWKKGRPTVQNAIDGEIKAYGRQYSYNRSSVPSSSLGGKPKSLNDINQAWVYGIKHDGQHVYINFVFGEKANVKSIKRLLKNQ